MKRYLHQNLLISVFLFFIFNTVKGQEDPFWLKANQRADHFPESKYYTGFIARSVNENVAVSELEKRFKELAIASLIESIGSLNQSTISIDHFKTILEEGGLKTECLIDKSIQKGYGFAYIEKGNFLEVYYSAYIGEMNSVKKRLTQISIQKDSSFNIYKTCIKLQQKLEDIVKMRNLLKGLGLSEVALMTDLWRQYFNEIQEKIDGVISEGLFSFDESTYILAEQIYQQIKHKDLPLILRPISFSSTGFGSELSYRLQIHISNELKERGIKIINPLNYREELYLALSGIYKVTQEDIHVAINVHEERKNETIQFGGGTSLSIPKSILREKEIQYLVNDVEQLVNKKNILSPSSLSGENLDVELMTQRGGNSIIFRQGDTLKLYVAVNQPSYLRLINISEDDLKLLLLDNFFVDGSQVNKIIELPFMWETICPCGVEFIKLYAQDKPFKPLKTSLKGNMEIINGALKEVAGYDQQLDNKGVIDYKGSSLLIITTLPDD